MASWIYVFSKFTPEALLFEALIICVLCASYAAFWVLKKRRYGVLGQETPAYAVKSYLSQLIIDAEQMRIQLFGLLAGTGVDPNVMANLRAAGAGAGATAGASPLLAALGVSGGNAAQLTNDPALQAKLSAIEAKMVEQARAIETIVIEKTRVEKELIEARAGKGGGGGGAEAPVDNKLAEKIKALEAKLAEYSVIEDDLANLKRLQQENAQLKAQLGGKAPTTSKATSAAPPTSEAPEVAEPMADPMAVAAETATEVPAAVAAAAPIAEAQAEEAAAAAAAATEAAMSEAAQPTEVVAEPAPIAAATGDANFEGLVDQVEQSIAQPVEEAAAPAAEAAVPPAGASVADPASAAPQVTENAGGALPNGPEKTDADLVAEFEKMLNS